MPKDLKNSPPPRDSRPMTHPMLLGIIIGLLLGIVLALAVALWLNRLSNPFVDKVKPIEPLAKIGPVQPPKSDDKGAAASAADAKAGGEKPRGERPRFEFYTMLPGEREVTDTEAKQAAAKTKAPGKAPPDAPRPAAGETYWLQAGAFADERDADNLKAKIAFSGLEASVKAVDVPGKGLIHRVRLGPYRSLETVNRIKAELSQSGVSATIIRTDEATKP